MAVFTRRRLAALPSQVNSSNACWWLSWRGAGAKGDGVMGIEARERIVGSIVDL